MKGLMRLYCTVMFVLFFGCGAANGMSSRLYPTTRTSPGTVKKGAGGSEDKKWQTEIDTLNSKIDELNEIIEKSKQESDKKEKTINSYRKWFFGLFGSIVVAIVTLCLVRSKTKIVKISNEEGGVPVCPRCGEKYTHCETKCRKCGTRF